MDYFYLFFIAFLSATVFPLGSEALLLYDLSLDFNVFLLFTVATIGNTLGSLVNYYLGLKGEKFLVRKKIIKKEKVLKTKRIFDKYGGYTLLFSWVPIIGDPITIVAGMLLYNIKKFIYLTLISKGIRYLFVILSYYLYTNN
ncbi:MAG: membrane protein YqaA with SNARE-associated domain [Arcobacteraceae bacterium]|jgi:membrane protein YqaA with SNARE-associated domain